MIIYKTTNKINGKIYIGFDTKNNPNYYGSGKVVVAAIEKYGKVNFKKEILEICKTKELLSIREIYWISTYNSTDRNIGYNISNGGNGGDLGDVVNDKIRNSVKLLWSKGVYKNVDYSKGHPCSDETKLKISNTQKAEGGYWYGKKFTTEHMALIKKNTKIAYENGAYENLVNAMRSKKVRDKISTSLKGKLPWNAGKTGVYTEAQLAKFSESAKSRITNPKNEAIRRDKISKYFKENHPNVKKVLDTRTNVEYRSLKHFCDETETSWYRTKKLRVDKIIIIIKE